MTPSYMERTRSLDTERASGLFGLGYAAIWNPIDVLFLARSG